MDLYIICVIITLIFFAFFDDDFDSGSVLLSFLFPLFWGRMLWEVLQNNKK